MNIPISCRLLACCAFVRPGDRVADVGCDHGYLGIHLLTKGIASFVIASDIHRGPLNSAIQNADKYGVADKMSFHLSDGLSSVPRNFDVLICAGMGADTMISILNQSPWLKSGSYRLILQCQSKISVLRRYLSETGWHIVREVIQRDGRFLYTVMEVLFQNAPLLSPGQWYIPPALLYTNSEDLPEYFYRVTEGLKKAVYLRKEQADPLQIAALQELETLDLPWLKEDNHDNR